MPAGEKCRSSGGPVGPPQQKGGGPVGPPRWTVLVVDDEEEVRRVARECIRLALGEEYRVMEAKGGAEAVDMAQKERPDLILLDILMPEVDGFEVCRRLKATPATSHIPILFLTARGEQEAVEIGLGLGGDGYMVKPFNAVSLAAQVSELVTCAGGARVRRPPAAAGE